MNSHTRSKIFFSIAASSLFFLISCGLGNAPDQGEDDGHAHQRTKLKASDLDAICEGIGSEKNARQLNSLSELKKRFLDAHNDVRRRYGLDDLEWDDNLAAYAQDWATKLKNSNKCAQKHRTDADRKGEHYGENIAWNWDSRLRSSYRAPEDVVFAWSKECEDYNYDKRTCAAGEQCGHFTQVVWSDSKKVGCGVATCDGANNTQNSGHVEVWVCNYSPAGNIYDQHGMRSPF